MFVSLTSITIFVIGLMSYGREVASDGEDGLLTRNETYGELAKLLAPRHENDMSGWRAAFNRTVDFAVVIASLKQHIVSDKFLASDLINMTQSADDELVGISAPSALDDHFQRIRLNIVASRMAAFSNAPFSVIEFFESFFMRCKKSRYNGNTVDKRYDGYSIDLDTLYSQLYDELVTECPLDERQFADEATEYANALEMFREADHLIDFGADNETLQRFENVKPVLIARMLSLPRDEAHAIKYALTEKSRDLKNFVEVLMKITKQHAFGPSCLAQAIVNIGAYDKSLIQKIANAYLNQIFQLCFWSTFCVLDKSFDTLADADGTANISRYSSWGAEIAQHLDAYITAKMQTAFPAIVTSLTKSIIDRLERDDLLVDRSPADRCQTVAAAVKAGVDGAGYAQIIHQVVVLADLDDANFMIHTARGVPFVHAYRYRGYHVVITRRTEDWQKRAGEAKKWFDVAKTKLEATIHIHYTDTCVCTLPQHYAKDVGAPLVSDRLYPVALLARKRARSEADSEIVMGAVYDEDHAGHADLNFYLPLKGHYRVKAIFLI